MKTSNKRNKKQQSIESEIMIDMKAARKSRQRDKILKLHLVLIKKQTERRHSVVEEIFKDGDIDNDVVYTEEYSSSEESISSNSEEEKASTKKINMPFNDYKKDYVLGNGNWLFASLDKLVYNDSFGSFSLRQLIVDRVSDN